MVEDRMSNRSFAVLLVVLILSWIAAQLLTSILFPASQVPFSPASTVSGVTFIAVLMGFMIYAQRLKDERTMRISDKATRNGFAFILFVVPVAVIALSATSVSADVSLALVLMWVGAVAVAAISAFYYYRE